MKITIIIITIFLLTLPLTLANDLEMFTPKMGDTEGYSELGDEELGNFNLANVGGITASLLILLAFFIIFTEKSKKKKCIKKQPHL